MLKNLRLVSSSLLGVLVAGSVSLVNASSTLQLDFLFSTPDEFAALDEIEQFQVMNEAGVRLPFDFVRKEVSFVGLRATAQFKLPTDYRSEGIKAAFGDTNSGIRFCPIGTPSRRNETIVIRLRATRIASLRFEPSPYTEAIDVLFECEGVKAMEAPPAARPRQYYVSPAVPTKEAVALRFTVTTSEQVRREFQLSIQPANIDPKSGTTYGPIPLSENVLLPIDQRTNPALAAVRAEYRKMAQTELERINFKAKVSLE